MKKGQGFTQLAIVIITVIVAILGITGFAAYKYFAPKQQINTTASLTPIPDEIANWKTLKDDEYGFEMRYPDSWRWSAPANLGDRVNYAIFFCPNANDVCQSELNGIDLIGFVDKSYNKDSSAYYLGYSSPGKSHFYLMKEDSSVDEDIFSKIISTFKFIPVK